MSQPANLFDAAKRVSADADVETRAARGERQALEILMREHAGAVLSLCRALVGPGAARDVAQDALAKVVTNVRLFDPTRGTFRQFALAIARNVCRDFGRRRKLENAAFSPNGDEVTAIQAAREETPEATVANRAAMRGLDSALSEMPEGMREAIVRFHLHEASYEEIAADLGVPIGTVMSWLHRARQRLREELSGSER